MTFAGGHTSGEQQHWVYVGTTPGGLDLASQDMTGHTATVSNLPNGTIHVRYWTKLASGCTYTDQQYTKPAPTPPPIVSPAPG